MQRPTTSGSRSTAASKAPAEDSAGDPAGDSAGDPGGASQSPEPAPSARPSPSSQAPPVRPERVLVVDDEPGVLELLAAILARSGYEVHKAQSLTAALAAMHAESFQLVLSDLYLGNDLAYRLAEAADALRPRVPVVLLTGRPSFDGAAEALRNRVAEIAAKPIDPVALLATCRRTIQAHRLRTQNEDLAAQNRVLAEVLPRAIEAKDPTTSGHADRVVRYADVLAQRCSVSLEDRGDLRLAALLHDVGKIGVPDRILTKPGSLTPDERLVVERHPAMGFEILAPLRQHERVRQWVYQHHERWDGKGYPEGLGGEEVALPGRILILAEVYDALAEERSYKPAWPVPRIVALFREQAGRHFDPDLARLVADGLEREQGRFFDRAPAAD